MRTKILGILSIVLFSTSTFGSGSQGKVTTPLVTYKDLFIFSAGNHNDPPDCVATTLGTWAVDLKAEHGKAMLAVVMSAHAQGKELKVIGRGVCDVKGDRESVNYLYIVE